MAKKDHLKLRPGEQYIVMVDLDFSWDVEDVKKVRQMWENGDHLALISGRMSRDPDETACLLMDMARKGMIPERTGGALGAKV